MRKNIFALLSIIIVILVLKVLMTFMAEEYLSKVLNQRIKFTTVNIFPFKIQTLSLDGTTTLTYEQSSFNIYLDNVSLNNFNKMIVQKGKISGLISYNPFDDTGTSRLKASNIIVNGIDLDRKLLFFNDVIGFNIVSLFRNFLKNINKSTQTTNISHLEFSTTLRDGCVHLDDVAFSSEQFRIVLLGEVHVDGDIKHFEAHLVDKNACSIISQELTGNIKNPYIKKTKTFVKIAKAVPSSMFRTGMKMAAFTKHNMDTVIPKNQQYIGRQLLSQSDKMFKKTSQIVMPKQCHKIYNGNVHHPLAYKKGFI